MEPCLQRLTDSETARNIHGPHLLYEYVAEILDPFSSPLPGKFPDIAPNHAKSVVTHLSSTWYYLTGLIYSDRIWL